MKINWPWKKKQIRTDPHNLARPFDHDHVDKAYQDIVEIFRERRLTVGELLVVYGNLGYTLGASIEGYPEGKGPPIEDLNKLYYSNPSVGIAMMIQGYTCTSWYSDWIKRQKENKGET